VHVKDKHVILLVLVILLILLAWMIHDRFPAIDETNANLLRYSDTDTTIGDKRSGRYLWNTESCITYTQRYEECKTLQMQDAQFRRNVFAKRGRSGSAQELTILRMGKWNNDQDHWLSVLRIYNGISI